MSLFVRFINLETGETDTRIVNKKKSSEELIPMNEIELKYGCNPNQKPSKIYMENGSELPINVLCGKPGYINLLDALNGWQLVK